MKTPERVTEATDHLLSVARCPIVADCLAGRSPGHPCEELVLSQWPRDVSVEERAEAWPRWHQLPEPWAGHLREARLLFVASNPGLRRKIIRENLASSAPEHITTWERDDTEIIRRSVTALDDVDIEGVPYWRRTHELAIEVLGPDARPGVDYALTEAIRCKSPGETSALDSARRVCSRNYLRATILFSGAHVILGMGKHARIALARMLPLEHERERERENFYETVIGPRRYIVAMLPHPTAPIAAKKKTLEYNLECAQIQRIRDTLSETSR